MKKILSLNIVVLVFILIFSPIAVYAYTDAGDIAECERLNLINGCNCNCREENQVCEPDPSVDINLSKEGTCVSRAPGLKKSSTTSNLGFRFFPTIGNSGGFLILDASGNLLLGATLANIFKWLFWILALIAVAMGLYGAFLYSTARDSDDQVEKAGKLLRAAVIGFIIVMFALVIVLLASKVLGFEDDIAKVDDRVVEDPTDQPAEQKEEDNLIDKWFR